MRRALWLPLIALIAVGCGSGGSVPQAGDLVAPNPTRPLAFTAGSQTEIWCFLQASRNGNSRPLGFNASPKKNPVATVTFYDADGKGMAPLNVELSERC